MAAKGERSPPQSPSKGNQQDMGKSIKNYICYLPVTLSVLSSLIASVSMEYIACTVRVSKHGGTKPHFFGPNCVQLQELCHKMWISAAAGILLLFSNMFSFLINTFTVLCM